MQLIIARQRVHQDFLLNHATARERAAAGINSANTALAARAEKNSRDHARRSPHGAMLPPWLPSWLLPPLLLVAVSSAAAEDLLDLLWPSPLLKIHDPLAQQQNAALKKLIMGVARNSPGVSKTNIGGWQSDVHFFERTEVPVTILRTRAYHAVFRYLQVHLFQPPQITFCGP